MGISSGCSSPNSVLSGKQFALVTYLPAPLAQFLDDLRLELVPDCSPHAHVSILPPRPMRDTPRQAMEGIREVATHFEPFTLRLGEVKLFPVSNVVYIEIVSGREELFNLYRAMNSGVLSYQEAYPYCPHITLAQRLEPDAAQAAFEVAQRAWKACRLSRRFTVEALQFVESDEGKCWRDLDEARLQPQPALAGATRTDAAEPSYRA